MYLLYWCGHVGIAPGWAGLLKLHPSSYTPVEGQTTNGKYKESCLRYLSVHAEIARLVPRTEIHDIYKAIGTFAEVRHEARLGPGVFLSREVRFEHDLGDGVRLTGRCDFLLPDAVHEVKASVSPTNRALWRKGRPLATHLGQLVTYMVVFERAKGRLNCSYVHLDRNSEHLEFEDYVFDVRIQDGDVLVNDLPPVSLDSILVFWRLAKETLLSPHLAQRPTTRVPCSNCPFLAVCDSSPQDLPEFRRQVVQILEQGTHSVFSYVPTIKSHDTRKKDST